MRHLGVVHLSLLASMALFSEGCFRDGSGPADVTAPPKDSEQNSGQNSGSTKGAKNTTLKPGSKDSKLGGGVTIGKDGKPVAGTTPSAAGTVGTTGTTDTSETAPKAEPPKPECFTVGFKHKALAAHRDGEACLNHDNAFKIEHARLNTKTVCVRVNGTPVKHTLVKSKPGLVVIGPVAGPESLVTVRWCTDKTTCKENCAVPKDDFMDAIGGMEDAAGAYVQWDAADGKKGPSADEVRLEKELKTFGGGKRELFEQWVAEREPKLTCGTEADRSVANLR
jgi:hypothetical protein